jgi:hypothetical protein
VADDHGGDDEDVEDEKLARDDVEDEAGEDVVDDSDEDLGDDSEDDESDDCAIEPGAYVHDAELELIDGELVFTLVELVY